MVRQALTMRNVPRPGPPPDLVLALRDAIAEDAVLIECWLWSLNSPFNSHNKHEHS